MDIVGCRFDIACEKLRYLLCLFCDQHGLAVRVEAGPAGPSCHLPVLADRDRLHTLPGREPEVVADYDPACRKIKTCGKGRCGGDALDPAFAERFLHNRSLVPAEAGMVERGAFCHTRGKGL